MKNRRALLAVPYVGWMALFVIAPILIMVVYSFTTAAFDPTLANYTGMGTYTSIFLRSFQLALIATAICLLVGYPLA